MPELQPPISEDRFFRGFLAALRQLDVQFVETRDDLHHARFRHAMSVLDAAREQGSPAAKSMPRTLRPSQFTGRYAALDAALITAQAAGRAGAQNPFYPGADLGDSLDRTKAILRRFTGDQQELFDRMARAFDQAGDPAERRAGDRSSASPYATR